MGLAQAPQPQGPVRAVPLYKPAAQPPQFEYVVQIAHGRQIIVTAPDGWIQTQPGFISGTTTYIITLGKKAPGQP